MLVIIYLHIYIVIIIMIIMIIIIIPVWIKGLRHVPPFYSASKKTYINHPLKFQGWIFPAGHILRVDAQQPGTALVWCRVAKTYLEVREGTAIASGCFQKLWYPQIINFNRIFHYKPSILGYPYFWKHPSVVFNLKVFLFNFDVILKKCTISNVYYHMLPIE